MDEGVQLRCLLIPQLIGKLIFSQDVWRCGAEGTALLRSGFDPGKTLEKEIDETVPQGVVHSVKGNSGDGEVIGVRKRTPGQKDKRPEWSSEP